MSEGIFESYDPLAYMVKNVSALDKDLCDKDKEKIEEIIDHVSPLTADVFITIYINIYTIYQFINLSIYTIYINTHAF